MPDHQQLALRAYLLDAITATGLDVDGVADAMQVHPVAVARCLAGIERPSERFARRFAAVVRRPAAEVLALAGYAAA